MAKPRMMQVWLVVYEMAGREFVERFSREWAARERCSDLGNGAVHMTFARAPRAGTFAS